MSLDTKPTRGRKRVYSEEQQQEVIKLLKKLTVREVAQRTGISKSTVDRIGKRK